MQTARAFRLAEASFIVLFFITAARTVVAMLLSLMSDALTYGQFNLNVANAHLLVVAAVALSWFSPRLRTRLPATLALTALVVAIARVPMTFLQPTLRFYAALIVFGFGGVYVASLIRASYRSLFAALVVAGILDQLARTAGHTLDVTLTEAWVIPQIIVSIVAIVVSRQARARAKHEVYEPANLTLWNGLALGAFLFLELGLLSFPNSIARWAGVPYKLVAQWLILATSLTLSPRMRLQFSRPLSIFDERTRGWVWILLLALLVVLGNRTSGPLAAGSLVVAQIAVLLMLWWIPVEADPGERDDVGPAVALGLMFFVILSYVSFLVFQQADVFLPLEGQALTLHLVAVVVLGSVLVGWRTPDPWHVEPRVQASLPAALVAIAFVATLIAVNTVSVEEPVDDGTLRIASFDIHYGFNPFWRFDLELIARSIEVADADIVALQRVDVGRQSSYGVDQVYWLAQRLGMQHAYYPTIGDLTGLAVLSRWPIEESDGNLLVGAGEQMGVVHAVVRRTPGTRAVDVYGTRLSPDIVERLVQSGALVSYIGADNVVVLAGNLVMAAGDDSYNQLTASNLLDPNARLNIVQDFTYPSTNPAQRHDYVLIRGLEPIESQKVCGPDPASDHCLVVVEVIRP